MNKFRLLTICCFILLSAPFSYGQSNVGIGTATPDASALLHLDATNKGMLVPRMTTAQRNAISATPVDGLLVYDTDIKCFFFSKGGVWTSLCSAGGGGGDNTSFTYDPATNVLSLTDAGGTLSTTIPPLGRWSAKGTTDISYTATQAMGFAPMAGTQLTFTPTKSVVYIVASASGDVDINRQTASAAVVRIRDTGANTTIAASQTLVNASFLNPISFALSIAAAWNVALTSSYTVTPGVPVTLELQWSIGWADGQAGAINCKAATDGSSHRSIMVYE